MIVILGILIVLLVVLLGVSVISSSMTAVAMSDALRAQAQATQALALAELIRTLTGFFGATLLLAVIVLVIVAVNKRRAARNVIISPRTPQLQPGTQIEQLTQLFTLQLMRDMAKQQSLYSEAEREQK